jgi:hypothetical protein
MTVIPNMSVITAEVIIGLRMRFSFRCGTIMAAKGTSLKFKRDHCPMESMERGQYPTSPKEQIANDEHIVYTPMIANRPRANGGHG